MENPYLPYPVRIEDINVETEDKSLKTFKFVFLNKQDEEKFAYKAGQFAELSIPGKGEIPIGIASSPVEKGFVKFTVFKAGVVTSHLHAMKVGDIMGIRGPLGNWYPWELLEQGKNVFIIGGGFAFTTLRSSIVYMLDPANRSKFGTIDLVYGARTPGMFLFKDELIEWEKRSDINVHLTIDREAPNWDYHVGLGPNIAEQVGPKGGENSYAIACGPPIMIKFTLPVLQKLGYSQDHIILSLENRMKCGIGMCGRCGIGKELVCKDGPVFTLEQIGETPREY